MAVAAPLNDVAMLHMVVEGTLASGVVVEDTLASGMVVRLEVVGTGAEAVIGIDSEDEIEAPAVHILVWDTKMDSMLQEEGMIALGKHVGGQRRIAEA